MLLQDMLEGLLSMNVCWTGMFQHVAALLRSGRSTWNYWNGNCFPVLEGQVFCQSSGR